MGRPRRLRASPRDGPAKKRDTGKEKKIRDRDASHRSCPRGPVPGTRFCAGSACRPTATQQRLPSTPFVDVPAIRRTA